MARYVIVPIVEGRGEVEAVPILLRAWLRFRRYQNVEAHADGPVFANGKGNITATHNAVIGRGIEHWVRVAMLRRPRPDVILLILDADDDCPVTLAAGLLTRARTVVPADFPLGVVVANRKYEAWLLAAYASASFRKGLESIGFRPRQRSLPRGMDVEAIADCERRIEALIDFREQESDASQTSRYSKTTHQPRLTQILPFTNAMRRRSRSFRKLLTELDQLLVRARRQRNQSETGNSPRY